MVVFPVRLSSDALTFSLRVRLGHFTESIVGLCVTNVTSFPPFPRLL